VIVGSVKARAKDTKPIIREVIKRLKPDMVGSGEADGTDTHVKEVVEGEFKGKANYKGFPPETKSWNGWHGYKWRNLQMVNWGTHFVRIASIRSGTYGSGFTVDQAEILGKPVERFMVS